jgi:hypothetical protein
MTGIAAAKRYCRWVVLLALALAFIVGGNQQGAKQANAGPGFILIFKTGPDAATPLSQSCFDVRDSGEAFLFKVCDNDFQGAPQSHALCTPDGVCNDEASNVGDFQVTVSSASFSILESKAPPGYLADPNPQTCTFVCKLLFVNQPQGVGGVAEVPAVIAARNAAPPKESAGRPSAAIVAAGLAGAIVLATVCWFARKRLTRARA